MKVIFMGTADFAVPSLEKLITSSFCSVEAVFTAKPKKRDRGLIETPTLIHQIARSNNITCYTPDTLRDANIVNTIERIVADIIVVVAYGLLVPTSILYTKKYGSINLHPSSLPKYRGAAPLQRTIINGENSSSICIMQMDEGFDTGAVILREDFPISANMTYLELHDFCASHGANLLIEALKNIHQLPRIPQDHSLASYAHKLSKTESTVNWQESAKQIECRVRGMNPWPGLYFHYNGKTIKILEAEFNDQEHTLQPGLIVDDKLKIACGKGFLMINKLQQSGKRALMTKEFLRGNPITSGTILTSAVK